MVIAWGLAMFALYNLALNSAERHIDAGTAALLVNLAPLLVVLIAGLLGEGFPRGLVVGAPVSFVGVGLIGTQTHQGRLHAGGLALALAAAGLYAGCTIVQKRLLATVDAAELTWLGATAGTVALLPWSGSLVHDITTAPRGATLAVVYLGVFPTALAFTTWAYVLKRSSAGRTSATTYVVPALTIVMSWVMLGEAPSAVTVTGGVLCLLGVFVTRLRRRLPPKDVGLAGDSA